MYAREALIQVASLESLKAIPWDPPTEQGSLTKTICHGFIHKHREKPDVHQDVFTKVIWKIVLRRNRYIKPVKPSGKLNTLEKKLGLMRK